MLRIHSPGGGVTACDILAEELELQGCDAEARGRLPDGRGHLRGFYYLALGGRPDRGTPRPRSQVGIGVVFNHVNLQDAMAQLPNVSDDPIKAGTLIDMGA